MILGDFLSPGHLPTDLKMKQICIPTGSRLKTLEDFLLAGDLRRAGVPSTRKLYLTKWSRFRSETESRCVKSQSPTESILNCCPQIYCDIFRPVTDAKIPAILAVSPYGKNGNGMLLTTSWQIRQKSDGDTAARISYFRQYSLPTRTTGECHIRS